MDIPPKYDPRSVEERLYKWWLEQGLFNAAPNPSRKPYTIVIPPPNVTGVLTIGHVLNNTYQDILIRYRRMQGRETLWLPGMDHAGIATQNVVERELKKEGTNRHALGRDKFVERTWQKARQNLLTIRRQLQRLGASCDWRRERFTMDEGLSRAVTEVFVRLYRKGLIYRDRFMINWCPRCTTALSDDEVEHREITGGLYWIRYPSEQGEGVVICTTRPETMLGDTAVAVNPKDARYKHLVGQTVILPLVNRRLKVIADESVDPEFGTGALKVTPAHDPVDFAIGQRHSLEICTAIGKDGRMTDAAGPYKGMERLECRKAVLRDLKAEGLLLDEKPYQHSVGHCSRCETQIEPYISVEWFVRMKPLAEQAIAAVREGRIRFHPERWTAVYYNWLENVRDWCISRQLWWGHRIPAWHCTECNGISVETEPPQKCTHCGSTNIAQDPDVLDTWFSSWLWPFSTLGWPEDTPELRYFYPTDTLITAPDIIFFWVARMIMAGLEFMGDVPFRDVYLHGIVRDEKGRKMSKSLGNSPDVFKVLDQFGTDSLRFSIILITAQGQDAFYSDKKVEIGRNFTNKIWNAARLLFLNIPEDYQPPEPGASRPAAERFEDRWILSRLAQTGERVTKSLDGFHFNDAARSIYDFFWGDYCDWYLEMIKPRMASGDTAAFDVATFTLDRSLRMLHPFCPFLTEEIWQKLNQILPHRAAEPGERSATTHSIMLSPWFSGDKDLVDEEVEKWMLRLQGIIRAIRAIRKAVGLADRSKLPAVLSVETDEELAFLRTHAETISRLAWLDSLEIDKGLSRPPGSAADVAGRVKVFVPLAGFIDLKAEQEKLRKRIEQTRNALDQNSRRLANSEFTSKAPAEVIEKERERNAAMREELDKLEATLRSLSE